MIGQVPELPDKSSRLQIIGIFQTRPWRAPLGLSIHTSKLCLRLLYTIFVNYLIIRSCSSSSMSWCFLLPAQELKGCFWSWYVIRPARLSTSSLQEKSCLSPVVINSLKIPLIIIIQELELMWNCQDHTESKPFQHHLKCAIWRHCHCIGKFEGNAPVDKMFAFNLKSSLFTSWVCWSDSDWDIIECLPSSQELCLVWVTDVNRPFLLTNPIFIPPSEVILMSLIISTCRYCNVK